MRTSKIIRETKETKINLDLNIDGSGKSNIDTGCGFLDHMLTLLSKHSRIDLNVKCVGDTQVDYHHTVEDVGIVLGLAFKEALGNKLGICRYGSFLLPMDEALVMTAIDISGRGYLVYNLEIPTQKVGDFDTELVKEFWIAFTKNSDTCLHIHGLDGDNSHHIIEAAFKSVARSMRQAVSIDKDFADEIPSTKGVL